MKRKSKRAAAAGSVTLTIAAKGKALKQLKEGQDEGQGHRRLQARTAAITPPRSAVSVALKKQ